MLPNHRIQRASSLWRTTFVCTVFALGIVWLGWSQPALAKKGSIHLFAPETTYTPGKPVIAYVYFFRVPQMGFWGQNIGSSHDFRLLARKSISSVRERFPDPGGSPFPEVRNHMLYRIRLMPKTQGKTLRYGPVRIAMQVGSFRGLRRISMKSNTLTFTQKTLAPGAGKIQAKVVIPQRKLSAHQGFDITYTVQCPMRLCDYQRIGHQRTLELLKGRVELLPSSSFSVPQTAIRPKIESRNDQKPPMTWVHFHFKMYPLKKGSLRIPGLKLALPTLNILDQRPILKTVRKWLVSKGIPRDRVHQYVRLDRNIHASMTERRVLFPRKTIQVQASPGLQGSWNLVSQIVRKNQTTYWKLSLTGKGFLQATTQFFREQIQEKIKQHKLASRVQFAHMAWRLPDGRVDGRITLEAYFKVLSTTGSIPSISMQFVDAQGKKYIRKTLAVAVQKPTVDDTPFQAQSNQNHIYIHQYKQPTTQQPEQVTVWGYKLPKGFPLSVFLKQRWDLQTTPHFKETEVGQLQMTTRRTVRDPFTGSLTYMHYSGPVAVKAQVAHMQAQVRTGTLALFPAVKWGNRWYFVKRISSQASKRVLRWVARTQRKRYFAGETVEYTLGLRFSRQHINDTLRTFFKEQLFGKLKLLKEPNLSSFSSLRVLDRFKLYSVGSDALEFRYRVQFKAPEGDRLKIPAATLRLPYRVLRYIYYKHQTCLFPEGGSQALLFKMLAREHHNRTVRSGGECGVGTQILTSPTLIRTIDALPDQAKQLQLIGSFRLTTKLAQLSFPNKNSTIADKPFYLMVKISGDGDLKTARELMRDQLSQIGRQLRKQNVTTYIETPNDAEQPGSVRIQMQIIAEEVGHLQIPSLKLKYYHREEGVLTAQTLPMQIKIEARTGNAVVRIPARKKTLAKTKSKRVVQQTTDLRSNRVVGASVLENDFFALRQLDSLLLLLFGPGLFVLFFGWHRWNLQQQADPERNRRNQALRQLSQKLRGISFTDSKEAARVCIDALQRYLIERLSLKQKQLTAADIEDVLRPYVDEDAAHTAMQGLIDALQQLEASLYGGDPIADSSTFLKQLEQQMSTLDRHLPKHIARKES